MTKAKKIEEKQFQLNVHIKTFLRDVCANLYSDNAALQEPDSGMLLARNPDREL